MERDRTQAATVAKRVAVALLTVGALFVAAGTTITLLPGGAAPMPPVIWAEGPESFMDRDAEDRDVRVGAADGPEIGGLIQVSAFGSSSPAGEVLSDGVSLRRPATGLQRFQYDLARHGAIPLHRRHAAGYQATGETVERDGQVWREYRLFDREFNYWQLGWWPW